MRHRRPRTVARDTVALEPPSPPRSRGYWAGVRRRLGATRSRWSAPRSSLLMLLAIVFAPLIAPDDPYHGSMLRRLRPLGYPGHLLGTDELGRDMLTRLLYGGRLSWFLGITPVVIAFGVGCVLGVVAGFAGGWLNMLIMRVTDVFYAFPSVLLAVAISGALGAGVVQRHPVADPGVHPADHPRRRERDHRRAQPGLRRVRARQRRRRRSRSCACTCCRTCSARSSSTPPA